MSLNEAGLTQEQVLKRLSTLVWCLTEGLARKDERFIPW